MKRESITALMTVFVFAFGFASFAFADEAKLMSLVDDLQKQMKQMQKTIDWQGKKIEELKPAEAVQTPAEVDFHKGLKDTLGSYEWLKGMKWKGDFRLRYEGLQNTSGNPTESNDQNRFRYRLRYGFEKDFGDETKVGVRLASGAGTDITSTNQSFDSNFSGKEINIDQAWAEYTPGWMAWGPIKEVKFVAGKFENPMAKRSTFLMWDGDVNPEGAYEQIKVKALKADNLDVDFSAVLGQWILEEGSGSNHDDAELYLYSGGLHFQPYVRGVEDLQFNTFFNLYNYSDYSLPGNWSRAQNNLTMPVSQGGPTYLATAFNVWETYNELAFQIDPLPKAKLWFQYAHNMSEGAPDDRAPGQNDLWGFGAGIGKAAKKGTWELGYAYGNVEVHSVPGNFVDSDFGSADTRGSMIKGSYALTDNLALNAAAFFTNAISAENQRIDQDRRLFQLDLVWKF